MVTTNTMAATRSSLELMLDKIQQLDNDQPKDSTLPALPVRPVSKARPPRSRSPLPFEHLQWTNNFEEDHDPSSKSSVNVVETKTTEKNDIIRIQKLYRGYKVRCHYKELKKGVISLQSFVRGENARRNYQYCTRVPYNVLIDLQKRVLITEAKIREKNEENIALKTRVKEIDTKWQHYEERMKSMEKKWQDELTYIQKRLAASKGNQCLKIRFDQNPDEYGNDHSEGEDELRKLKKRFKEWKKDYKNKLKETHSAFKKFGNCETSKIQKHWWGRLLL